MSSRTSMRTTQLARRGVAYPAAMAMLEQRRAQRNSRRYTARTIPRSLPAARFTTTGTEYKALDTFLAATADAGTSRPAMTWAAGGNICCLNLIQAGSSFFNRVGRKIQLSSLEVKFHIQPISSAGAAISVPENILRTLFIYDSAPNGAFPAIADVLQDTNMLGANSTSVHSGINLNYRDRFQVLRDIRIATPRIQFDASNNISVDGPVPQDTYTPFRHEFTKKLRNHDTCFRQDSTPAVIGDISTGAVFCLMISHTDFPANTNWNVTGRCRLRYSDP